jgi:hypothetical protein
MGTLESTKTTTAVTTFYLGKHLVDICRGEVVTGSGANTIELARSISSGGLCPSAPQDLPDPFGDRDSLLASDLSESLELLITEEHLEALTHSMSMIHSPLLCKGEPARDPSGS